MLDILMEDALLGAFRKHDNCVKSYIMQSLNNAGYLFENDEDFTKFSHKRLTRVIEEGKPDDVYFCLDYETENEKMIGKYSARVTSNLHNNGWTINFG